MTRVAACEPGFCAQPVLCAELLAAYPDSRLNTAGTRLRGEALFDFLRGFDAAIVGAEPIDGALLDALPELRIVSKWGVGIDTVDIPALAARGIRLGWSPGVNRVSVAELALCGMITALRRVTEANMVIRGGVWRRQIGRQLSGATVGILGCGRIGREVIRMLAPFGCRILVHDILDFPEFYAANAITPVDLDTLLSESDVVSIHVPFDDSTANLISAERLALMKPGAALVNTARGGIVDEAALKSALKDGRIGGAAFDVFRPEPPEDAELLNLPNLLATPHMGASAYESILAMGRAAIANIAIATVPEAGTCAETTVC